MEKIFCLEMDPWMFLREKCLFPKPELRANQRPSLPPPPPPPCPSHRIGRLLGYCFRRGRSETSKGSHRVKTLFQLKRKLSLVASCKINIQNLVACQSPQNNYSKIYWEKKISFTIQEEVRHKPSKETHTGQETATLT